MWWTWRDGDVVHMAVNSVKYMRQIVCLTSWVHLLHAVDGARQPVNCLACLGARRVGP